jgi:hypothetical protein
MIEPQIYRDRLIEALELAASPHAQLEYAATVPLADVVAEIVCLWYDMYYPSDPMFAAAFNDSERAALAEYAAVLRKLQPAIPRTLTTFHALPVSGQLAGAASQALAVLTSLPSKSPPPLDTPGAGE